MSYPFKEIEAKWQKHWGGLSLGISPTNSTTKNSGGIGLFTPQIGGSYYFTPEPWILNKKGN